MKLRPIFPKCTKVHYSGGIVYANGNRLPGWPCSCKACLKMLEKQDAFKETSMDCWLKMKEKGYCL